MTGALAGTTVVALEQAVAAPLATSRLADAGARVIKLERPEGDFARGYDGYVLGQSSYFVWNNRGKESCRVDLTNDDDLALVRAMLARADVFVQNLAPGATERLGLGSAGLRALHPRLIVCDIGGYAPRSPDYQRKAYDLLIQAEAGLAAITGSSNSGPSRVGISICDIVTGQAAYAAILEALIRRGTTGQGSHLQLSLFDTIAEYMTVPYLARRYGGQEPRRLGLAHPSIAPYGVFHTSDADIVLSIQNEREWKAFCEQVLGEPDLATDTRFAGNTERVRNRSVLDGHIQRAIGSLSAAELSALLDAARIAYGRVSTIDDLIGHRSASFAELETPAGPVEVPAPPVIVDGARPALRGLAELGEHDRSLRRRVRAAGRRQYPPRFCRGEGAMSLTRQLVRLIRGKDVSETDLEWAALFVLDTLACALGALKTEPARILAAVAPPASGDTARRAFYLGGLSHILEMDDLHRNSVTHPGCVVIPAAWTIADQREPGGRAFLEAVLAGYEACARVGMAVGKTHYRIWHNTSTCGPFGSAFAAGELLGLSEDRMVSALGNAGTQASGLWEFLSAGAMSKHLHTARAAESGVLAALLAQEGFTGPDRILEGEKGFFAGLCPDPVPDAVLARPDGPWELTRTSIKPWPCCRHTHPAIDAAIGLHADLKGAALRTVRVGTYRAALDVCDRPLPEDPYSAKFSLQHCVAMALRDGRIEQSSFDADSRRTIAPERAKVEVMLSPAIDAAYPDAWGAEISLETIDGRKLETIRRACKGDPENPVTRPEITEKARTLLEAGGKRADEAQSLIAAVFALVEDRPLSGLGLFRRGPSAPVREPVRRTA